MSRENLGRSYTRGNQFNMEEIELVKQLRFILCLSQIEAIQTSAYFDAKEVLKIIETIHGEYYG